MKLRAGVGGRLGDREQMLVERERLSRRCDGVADRSARAPGCTCDKHAGVACEPERARRVVPEQELRQLAHAVSRDAAADPLARHVPRPSRLGTHLRERVAGEVEAELGDEPQPAQDAERILAEARRRDGTQLAAREVAHTAEGVDQLARSRAGSAIALTVKSRRRHVLLERDRRVGDDREVAMARAGAPLGPRRCQLDARRRRALRMDASSRMEAHADELAVHLHVLDAPVRLRARRGARRWSTPGTRKSSSVCGDAEQLVAHGAADDVGVEPERADVAADRGRHAGDRATTAGARGGLEVARSPRSRPARPTGSFATSTVERAGGRSPTWRA